MKVLVTGASGLIGKHLSLLLAQDHSVAVRGHYHSSKALQDLIAAGVELFQADILRKDQLTGITDSCEMVVHSAARVLDYGTWEQFYEAHVTATRYLLEESVQSGVKRFIYISSFGVADGMSRKEKLPDETVPLRKIGIPYDDVKIEAEDLVKTICRQNGMEFVIIRPAAVLGPGSVWVTEPLKRLEKLILIDHGRHDACLIDARNLALGIRTALFSSIANGQTYFMVDDWGITWNRYLNDLLLGLRKRSIQRSVPFALAYPVAVVFEYLLPRLGMIPPITRKAVLAMGSDRRVGMDKAKSELNYRSVYSYEDCMKAVLQHHGNAN